MYHVSIGGCRVNRTLVIRAMLHLLWLTPRILPCRAGSLRREIRELSDGFMPAKPAVTMVSAVISSHNRPSAMATIINRKPAMSSSAPQAAMTPSGMRLARRRTTRPWANSSVKPMYANRKQTCPKSNGKASPWIRLPLTSIDNVVSKLANARMQINRAIISGPIDGVRMASINAVRSNNRRAADLLSGRSDSGNLK